MAGNVPCPRKRAQRKRELALSPPAVVVGVSCLKELRPSSDTMASLLVTGRVEEGRRSNYPRVMLIVVSS